MNASTTPIPNETEREAEKGDFHPKRLVFLLAVKGAEALTRFVILQTLKGFFDSSKHGGSSQTFGRSF